jgi:two-component system OmpR family response regulator
MNDIIYSKVKVLIYSKVKVLIVDDEENILNFIKMGLKSKGFTVECASDGNEAISIATKMNPHIVILDVMLPEVDGYTVCKEIKAHTNASVIMLTARDDIEDKITGLDVGADDYMVKPFDFRELMARINARLRGDHAIVNDTVRIGNFTINNKAHEISFKDRLVELSSTEYNLLVFLLRNQGITLSKDIILQNVWGCEFDGEYNLVEVYVSYLRNKIGKEAYDIIKTVRGVGYKVITK